MRDHSLPTVVDLFCGCGGFSAGFKLAGFEVLLGVDSDATAIQTFNRNFHNVGRIENIENIDGEYILRESKKDEVDVIVGGPPCQAFSQVAVAKWRSIGLPGSLEHPLNNLYKEYLRIIKSVRPKFFVIENVGRMFTIENGSIKKAILSTVGDNYRLSFYVVEMANYGIPQFRKRSIMIGNRLNMQNPILSETHSNTDTTKFPLVTLKDAIYDLPRISQNSGTNFIPYPKSSFVSGYALDRRKYSKGVYNHTSRKHSERDLAIFEMLSPGQSIRDLSESVNPYRSDIFADKFKKQDWDKPSSTILAHLSKDGLRFIHPDKKQNRSFTPREAARLQSFDDSFIFEGFRTNQYSHIGNAVPPLFAKVVGLEIKNLLKLRKGSSRVNVAEVKNYNYV
jgi:DNA (cytosine-5)-methyltransferase 1